MNAAWDGDLGEIVDARLIPGFWDEIVGHGIRSDGSWRFECLVCKDDVKARGGRRGGIQRPHFAHRDRRDCDYARAAEGESAEHHDLKVFVARCIMSHAGWSAHIEMDGPGRIWRADVVATQLFDMDAVFGRTTAPDGRKVVFEVQHSAQHSAITGDRTRRYEADGYEVVWLFDDPAAPQIGASPAVAVELHRDGTRCVVGGVWPARRCDDGIELGRFIAAVLERRVRYEPIPPTDRRRLPAGQSSLAEGRNAWVFAEDWAELEAQRRRRRGNDRIQQARDEAVAAVLEVLRASGPGGWRTPSQPDTAYAAIVEFPGGTVAVHPWCRGMTGDVVARLAHFTAVVVGTSAEKGTLEALGLLNAVLLEDFEPKLRIPGTPESHETAPAAETRIEPDISSTALSPGPEPTGEPATANAPSDPATASWRSMISALTSWRPWNHRYHRD